MTIYFSGAYIDSNLALNVYQFFESKYPFIADYDVEIYHTDLTDDNVKGRQERNGDEFLLHIDANLDEGEYIKTIFHELVHCMQDIIGLNDTTLRECEAYELEQLYHDQFITTEAFKVSPK